MVEWCEAGDDENPNDPCPACGATIKGDDKVRGVCQAWRNRPKPMPYLQIIVVDKYPTDKPEERE